MDKFKAFTTFSKHGNNIHDVIDANDINKIQDSVNSTEVVIASINDNNFVNKAIFEFEHNAFANAMFLDEISNAHYLDLNKSLNVIYDDNEKCVKLNNNKEYGELYTIQIKSDLDSVINDFFLVADIDSPTGTKIETYIVNENNEEFPIKTNDKKVLNLKQSNRIVRIKYKLYGSAAKSPKILGYSLLYFDFLLDASYGLINPDLSRLTETSFGNTILIRDRALEDKLVRVIQEGSITELKYDFEADGRLDHITTNTGETMTKSSLIYEDYYNSIGEIEVVLGGIKTAPISLEDSIDKDDIFVENNQ